MSTKPLSHWQMWCIAITVMLVTIIEMLDMTIVNVALPHMMSSLGANTDQITWVLTAYIVSASIVMILTGVLVQRLGCRKLLLINLVGFMLSSVLCGMSTHLSQIVLFRILQGMFGATLVPLSQYILQQTFPEEEQSKAFAIWGMGIMVAPVLGPSFGGVITEVLNWRWVFYINVPVCLFALVMAMRYIADSPTKKIPFDKVGLLWMTLAVGSLQIFLDRGNQEGWLQSNIILALIMLSVVSFIIFIYRGLNNKDNIINLHIFTNRNFTVATLLLGAACLGLMAIMALQPMMLEDLMGYSASFTGTIMAPRGLTCAVGMVMVGSLLRIIDARTLIAVGFALCALGTYLSMLFTVDVDWHYVMYTGAIQGLGMGLLFVPISMIALETLPDSQKAEGTGIFNFGRGLGSSIGISIFSTIFVRRTQINWNELGAHIDSTNLAVTQWLQPLHLSMGDSVAVKMLSLEVHRQAAIMAFNACHFAITLFFIILIPCAYLLKRVEVDPAKMAAAH